MAELTITKIETQKKNRTRLSIYLNDEFAFGLNAGVVAKFNLRKGATLSKDKIENILFEEEKKRIKEGAYRILAGRAHSEKELKDKLLQKGFDESLSARVVADLKEAKYIDDQAFALAFARSRILNKPMGEKLLRRELWQKGLKEELIDKAIAAAYSKETQEELAVKLVEKRKSHYQNLEESKRKKRLYDFLLRRGFDWEVAKKAIAENQ